MARSAVPRKQARPQRSPSAHTSAEPAHREPTRLGEWRRAMGYSQASVAAALGWTQSEVSRFERRHDVRVSTLASFVAALDARLELRARSSDGGCCVLELAPATTTKRKATR